MSTSYFESDIVELYFSSPVVRKEYRSFRKEIESMNLAEKDLFGENINHLNNEIFKLISDIPSLDKLFVSFTTSNSIFYRFSNQNSNCEYKLEVFFDYDENDSKDIQSILHLYEDGVKKRAYYGTIEEMYNIITKPYAAKEYSQMAIEYVYKSPETEIKQYTPELEVSYAVNS